MLRSTSEFVADEDYGILVAIVENLVHNAKNFAIKLPHDSILTNQNDKVSFAFSGIDAIKDMTDQISLFSPLNQKFEILMPTRAYSQKTRVGELFGMDVFADPSGDADNIMIKPKLS